MPRTQISTPSAANGMLSTNAEVQAIEEIAKALRGKVPQTRDTLFLVFDGYISVADGHYRSSDQYFVSWGPIPDLNSRLSKAKYVVLENKDETNPEIINNAGFKLISKLKAYSLYEK
jgi:hypothetical protein